MKMKMTSKIKLNRTMTLIVFSLLMLNVACRSNLQEPVTETKLNQFGQLETLARAEPDNRGIIVYDTYQILIANGSETISQIGERLGISGEKLALYNGLIPNYKPREKEMIALPEDQFVGKTGWSSEITSSKIARSNYTKQKISLANNPLRHRIEEGDTVYSLAREYNVSVNSIATWNGLGPDLDVKAGREIIIPATNIKATEDETNKNVSLDNNLKEKPKLDNAVVNQNKVPKDVEKEAEKEPLPKIDIVSVKPFIAPVEGKIISKYSQDKGSQNNNGVDYETIIGAPVRAVSNGKVVLISDIVGGNGKIILIKHENELITIYGRLTNIIVEKGQDVVQGQTLGDVTEDSDTNLGLMHFEVREGTKSINPETMIQ